jgi:hypothetical protein
MKPIWNWPKDDRNRDILKVTLAGLAAVVAASWMGKTTPSPAAALNDQKRNDQRSNIEAELRETIDWYEKRAWHMQLFYVVLVSIGSIAGFFATTLLNLDWLNNAEFQSKYAWVHPLVSSLPAVGSLATFIAATFGIRDLWQMREIGIYDAKRLAIDAERLSSEKGRKFEATRLAIKERLRRMEKRQALRVIGALGGGALNPED